MRLPRGNPAALGTPVRVWPNSLVRPRGQVRNIVAGRWDRSMVPEGDVAAADRRTAARVSLCVDFESARPERADERAAPREKPCSAFLEKFFPFTQSWLKNPLLGFDSFYNATVIRDRKNPREALWTGMVESSPSTCETGKFGRLATRVATHAGSFRIAKCREVFPALACPRRARLIPGRLSLHRICYPTAAGRAHAARAGQAEYGWPLSRGFFSDRFGRARLIWSSSRLAMCRFAQQRLKGWALPPQ